MKLSQNLTLKAKGEYGHVLVIQGVIGVWPLIAEELKFRLDEIPESEPLEVRISSPGGDPIVGVQLYTMLKQHTGAVTTIVEDFAMSAATLPMAAGDDRIVDQVIGQVMIHNATDEIWGANFSEQDHLTMAEILKRVNAQMRGIYAKEFGIDETTVQRWMDETKFFNAQEAVDAGVCTSAQDVNRVTELSDDDVQLAAHFKKKLKNEGPQTLPENDKSKTKSTTMNWLKSLKNTLSLGDDSDEADVVLSAKGLKNENSQLKADNGDLEEDLDEIKKERDELKEKLETYQADEQESEEEELDATLTAMVESFQIKASRRDEFGEKYEGNLEGLKALRDHIPEGAVKSGTSSKVTGKAGGLKQSNAPDRTSKYFNK